MTKRAVGIGGVFFKGRDPERLRAWYRDHLGLDVADWGGVVFDGPGMTVWNIFSADTRYFDPSPSPFMINYRVENLDEVLAALENAEPLEKRVRHLLDTRPDPPRQQPDR